VELPDQVGFVPFEVGAQQLQEEVVTAIRTALSIERYQQQIRTFQRFEHALRTWVAGDGVAERSAQLREDRRVSEKGDLSRGQVCEDLAAQIVRDHPVVALHASAVSAGGSSGSTGQGSEVQADGPSLRALHQFVDLRRFNARVHFAKQRSRLGFVHRQLLDADLLDGALGSEPGHREWQLGA